jgi:hypothetical protein
LRLFKEASDPDLEPVGRLYRDRFPLDEQEDWNDLLEWVRRRSRLATVVDARLYALKAGGEVQAMAFLQHDERRRLAWFGYVAARRGARSGAGMELVARAIDDLRASNPECRAVFMEVERPDAPNVDPRARRRRRARIRHFARPYTYWIRGCAYRQCRLSPSSAEDEVPLHLLYLPIPFTPMLRGLTRDETANVLGAIRDIQLASYQDRPGEPEYRAYLDRWLAQATADLPAWVDLVCLGDRAAVDSLAGAGSAGGAEDDNL